MKIAVTYNNGEIFGHFGHAEQFKIYTIENKEIISEEIVSTGTSGHGAIADFLSQQGVNAVICGGIGDGARRALAISGISLFGGVSGNADEAVKSFIGGTLSFSTAANCSHH